MLTLCRFAQGVAAGRRELLIQTSSILRSSVYYKDVAVMTLRYGKVRGFADFPPHSLLPMPALSPTMVSGNMGQWMLKEGDKIQPGVVICEVETDKATVDYEAQDEGYLAKILVSTGTNDIAVGAPIGVLVEDQESISAFKDYKVAEGKKKPETKKADTSKPEETKPKVERPLPTPAQTTSKPLQVTTGEASKANASVDKKLNTSETKIRELTSEEKSKNEPRKSESFAAPQTRSSIVVIPFCVSPLKLLLEQEQEKYEKLYGSTLMKVPAKK